MEVDVPIQRTVWVKHRPASAARGIVLVMTFPRELDARPAIARHVTTVQLSLDRDEAHTAEAVTRRRSPIVMLSELSWPASRRRMPRPPEVMRLGRATSAARNV